MAAANIPDPTPGARSIVSVAYRISQRRACVMRLSEPDELSRSCLRPGKEFGGPHDGSPQSNLASFAVRRHIWVEPEAGHSCGLPPAGISSVFGPFSPDPWLAMSAADGFGLIRNQCGRPYNVPTTAGRLIIME